MVWSVREGQFKLCLSNHLNACHAPSGEGEREEPLFTVPLAEKSRDFFTEGRGKEGRKEAKPAKIVTRDEISRIQSGAVRQLKPLRGQLREGGGVINVN